MCGVVVSALQLALPFPVRVYGGVCVMTQNGWQYEPDASPPLFIAGGGAPLPPRTPMLLIGTAPERLAVPCEGCNRDFFPKRRDVRFCSHSCVARTARARKFWTTRPVRYDAAAE